ncbi:MAG: alpha/beta fold hydrolase [Acidobacteriota bacterium]|nr:alpha/beta fold hydrolase [Acidobacteriota bacterium]
MDHDTRQVTAPDGRAIEAVSFGNRAGATVVTHHGSPGSASAAHFFDSLADEFFVVGLSRPGYSTSTRQPGRAVGAAALDVAAVLDDLGREDYLAVGWSGGGPHSLACAALGAPRCRGAWSLAGVAPFDVDFDWTEGMGPENVEDFALALEGGEAYEASVAKSAASFGAATPDTVIELFGGLLSDVDAAALADGRAREIMAATMVEAFSGGPWGAVDDDHAFFAPWGFAVADITVPVWIWYGDQDLMVPPTHGAWLGANVPGARVEHDAAEGHVSIVTGRLDALAEQLRAAAA